jgi:hypothetical protein
MGGKRTIRGAAKRHLQSEQADFRVAHNKLQIEDPRTLDIVRTLQGREI